ncbi:hypothetical protein HMPREF9370_2435 [Neisseria wadsworthii 9715]|uniref:Uncharacterized protein n=1 Tax=Neisseria wadsworthii 9715 TaxID=1030841 RepID=G4CTM5_9NEIS|nr:hypothetical protein HMPREF9370_2435 [Neisseria wadsworthii 9715]
MNQHSMNIQLHNHKDKLCFYPTGRALLKQSRQSKIKMPLKYLSII